MEATLVFTTILQYLFMNPHTCTIKWATTWQNQQNEDVPSEDSEQPGNPPSLSRVFAVRTKKAWVLSYPLSAQRRLWSDWADAQADLSLRWAHSHFVGFVTSRLKSDSIQQCFILNRICTALETHVLQWFKVWSNRWSVIQRVNSLLVCTFI